MTARTARPEVVGLATNDSQAIARCAERMERCCETLQQLRATMRRHPDFLLPRDQDLLEYSLADYLASHDELDRIAEKQQEHNPELTQWSRRVRTELDVRVASLAFEEPVLWRAMNQSFHRSGIPRGSCDRLLHQLTAAGAEPPAEGIREHVQDLIRRRALIAPALENSVRHSPPVELVSATRSALSSHVRESRKVFAAGIGRIKNPAIRPLNISPEQRAEIRRALRSGDVLLTYSAGYVSNWVIPGHFKHAATFVGTHYERHAAGLPAPALPASASETADVVEAVTEGVRLNHFEQMIASHVTRLVVLRPQLSEPERADQIADVLSYVGDEFDFSFDLTDTSDQICTEVVYRSLQGRGGIELQLTEHFGRRTLLPDDLLTYAGHRGRDRLKCVLIVDGASGTPNVLVADEAQAWLASLNITGPDG